MSLFEDSMEHREDNKIKSLKQLRKYIKRASEDPIINKQKTRKMKKSTVAPSCEVTTEVTNMKPKPGTAKPSGKIGKGGEKSSPTDGGSLKVKGGGKGKKK